MTDKLKKQIILNLPYLIFVYLFDKLCQAVRLAPGLELYSELNGYMTDVTPVCPPESFDDEFQAEVDHFVDCFANGEPCRSPAEDGVQIMRILDAVYESARTGHEVIL